MRPSARFGWLAAAAVLTTAPLALGAQDDLVLVVPASGPTEASADAQRYAYVEDGQVFVRDLASGTVELASRADGPDGAPASGRTRALALSDDGWHVAFATAAGNLSDVDAPDAVDVYVRDLAKDTTKLVSRAGGPAGAAGDDDSRDPVISADGRYVGFTSRADNLTADPASFARRVYVRDVVAGTTRLVSVQVRPGGPPADAFAASISADGQRIVFRSSGFGLSDDPGAGAVTHIYVRDMSEGRTIVASRGDGLAGAPGNSGSGGGDISADGRRVAFSSQATNLTGDRLESLINIYVRDLESGTTQLASRADGSGGAGGDRSSHASPTLSADGRYVAFNSFADNLSDADGPAGDVFLRDLEAGSTRLVSRAAGATGFAHPGPAWVVAISGTGRYVSFLSNGPLRDGGDPVVGIFRRDVLGGPEPRPTPPSGSAGNVQLTAGQLLINQRISQAALRRVAVLEAAAAGQSVPPAGSRTGTAAGAKLRVGQLRINQRISQAAVRRVNALAARLEGRPVATPPTTSPARFSLSVAQLRINQRISQAAVRRVNDLAVRLGVAFD